MAMDTDVFHYFSSNPGSDAAVYRGFGDDSEFATSINADNGSRVQFWLAMRLDVGHFICGPTFLTKMFPLITVSSKSPFFVLALAPAG
jgi:hypothetical protein